jgi:predicted ribosome quality control (RQC) complex YloA/Tae2 family protein
LREQGGLLTRDRAADQLQAERAAVRRALRKARGRIDRKRRAIAQDAARAEHAPELRRQGSMIVTHLSQIEPGDRELTAMDWEADPPVQRTIELDPARDPHQQAEQLFHRARRLERGAEIASERDRAAREDREILQELEQELEQARDRETVQALAERAREEGVRGLPEPAGKHSAGGRHHPPRRQPFRTFQGAHGRTIRVGRGSADNDALTLHHARPRDLWLHARGQRGAHVVVPLDRDESCPPELLIDAATLAAHFSEARGEPKVEVQYTPRRFVRKPRGAPPGAVTLEREKVVNLRVEPDRLSRLLGHPH